MGATRVEELLRCVESGARARAVPVRPELAGTLARAAETIAESAGRGGRMLVCGTPATASDVDHLVVEFVHPVVTGARSVAALACHEEYPNGIRRWIGDVARPTDVAVVVAGSAALPHVTAAVDATTRAGAAVVTLANEGSADLVVGSIDGIAGKELRVLAYHVLWELVQLYLARDEVSR